jgi:DNA-binding NarL/FixJ family response regulator
MRLPGLSGLDALRLMRRPASPQGLIAMSNFQDQQAQALRAGAHAFLLKESFGEELLAVIRAVYGGPCSGESTTH